MIEIIIFIFSLVLFAFFSIAFKRVHANFFIIFLKSSQIFSSFGELSFFHTFSNIPVDEGTLGVHQIKFMIQSGPSFSNGSSVAQHANSTWDLGQITTRNNSWWLIVDTDLESSRAPIYELH